MTDDPRPPESTAAASPNSPFDDGTLAVSGGTILDVDEAAADILALAPAELRGEPLSVLCPPRPTMYDADHLREAISRSVETGDSFEWVFDRGTAGEVTAEVAARPAGPGADEVLLFVRGTPSWTREDVSARAVERLHHVVTRFESCSEPAAVYELTVRAATEVLGFDTSTVCVAEGGQLVTKASTRDVPADVPRSVPLGHGLAGRTYRTRRSSRVDDVRTHDVADPVSGRYRSALSVPVGSVGVFQATATDVAAFSERDLELAELLAGHAADALERIRSVDALRDNRRRIARLHEVTDALVSAESESHVFELAVDAAEDILDFHRCTFVRVAGDRFVVTATSSELDLPNRVLELDEGVAGRVLRTGRSELVRDVHDDDDAVPLFDDVVSGIAIPVGDIAVFQAFSREPDAFSERDVELAELLTAHVATCVQRVRSARALERQRAQFSTLVAHLPGMVFRTAVDDVGRLEFVNDYAAELTGYDPAVLTASGGVAFEELVHPDQRDAIVDKRLAALADGTSYEATYRLVTADSGERWVRERATALFTDEADAATLEGFLTDVTGNRRRGQLEVLNRFLRHNLRNDVQVIYGHAENLEAGLSDDAALESVDRIKASARKLIGHSEKASTLEWLLGSEEEVSGTPLDLAEIVRRHVATVEEREDVRIDCSVTPSSCTVAGVPVLGAAVRETLENAVRHGGEPPVGIDVRLEVTEGDGRDDVVLTVGDDGPGIPEQDRTAIERRTETALTHSSGLGLWLVKWIVTASGGGLDIGESPSGGTELRMTFRRADGDAA